jgi:long-chain fatty acid transport protein
LARGSAWVARADDPLAAYFNPAAMAFQPTGVHLGAQLMMRSSCFTRVGPDGNPVMPNGSNGQDAPILPGQPQPGDGNTVPSDRVCAPATPFPNPQIAAVFRVANRVAVGLALVAPHASGANNWGESLPYTDSLAGPITTPSPQRYLLVNANALIVFPTASVAFAPTDYLSFGAGFVWGVGTVDFVTFSESLPTAPTGSLPCTSAGAHCTDNSGNDVRAELKAKDLFIPGVVLSALWMPTSNLDVAAWFKWQDALKASADVNLVPSYWNSNGSKNTTPPDPNNYSGAGTIKFQIPIEAKLGVRFHMPRKDAVARPGWASAPGRRVRDPMSEDLFDLELDFTYANNSAAQNLELQFHSNPPNPQQVVTNLCIGPPGNCTGGIPVNGNIPQKWKDVVGFRLGGDFVVIPNRLSLRAGGFYEIKGQDDAYLSLNFDLAQKIGVAGGGTVRLGPVDVSVGYQHTFYGTLNNGGNGQIFALAGGAGAGACGAGNPNPTPVVPGCYRSYQPVNGGSLTTYLNEVGLAATARF